MNKAVLAFCACAVLVGSLHAAAVKESMTSLRAVAISNHNFTLALYDILSKTEGNVFFSPLSIQMILALASMGAEGTTEEQMTAALSLPRNQQLIKDGFQKLMQNLKKNDDVIVKIANKILTDNHFDVKEEFINTAQSYFHADASKADFQNDADGARLKINRWVEDKTNNKIKDLFPDGSLTSDTVMVLANAVYFKANWATKFNREETADLPFYLSETEHVQVPMMQVKQEFFYKKCKELDAEVLEIPYVHYKMSMLIILPTKRDGLAEVEQKLANMSINAVTKHLRFVDVRAWIPSFKMEQTIDLKPVLKQMGMTDMFDTQNANFTGITDGQVHVAKAVHKSYIEVNEEGAEAAGATGIGISVLSLPMAPQPPVVFRADHPFLFFLVSRLTERTSAGSPSAILFMGRHAKPTTSS